MEKEIKRDFQSDELKEIKEILNLEYHDFRLKLLASKIKSESLKMKFKASNI